MGKLKTLDLKIFKKSVGKRRLFFFLMDSLLIAGAMFLAFWCRFNCQIPLHYLSTIPYYIGLAIAVKLSLLMVFKVYDISWRYVSLEVLMRTFNALTIGSLVLAGVLYFSRTFIQFEEAVFPRSVLIIDYVVSLAFIGALRAGKRVYFDGMRNVLNHNHHNDDKTKVLVIGAGSAGEQIVREMKRKLNTAYLPVGFIDDDPGKQKIQIHGVKVLGTRNDLPGLIQNNNIDEILIALPSVSSNHIRDFVGIIRQSAPWEKIKILPGLHDLINGQVSLTDIKKISVEDLLGRSSVTIAFNEIERFLRGQVVMVTGAGGSIGSEIVKTVLRFKPKLVIALDIDETELFNLLLGMDDRDSQKIIPVVGDVRDEIKMKDVFDAYGPEVVLHSAAYKHVPILEYHPEEAIKTNIMGTKITAELAMQYEAKKFVFISTDKAINPTSVMGASKRCSEELLKCFDMQNNTKFISVRFGNVLGSRGSVIPLFENQIRSGKALTVTHPEMKRYFMLTSEAVLLVLEAAAVGEGGEVFVLDMGEPIKIFDLAREMIRLSGKEPDVDIPIIFTGMRPGEKLFEEILSSEEGTEKTIYDKIYVARMVNHRKGNGKALMMNINRLIGASFVEGEKSEKIRRMLKKIVPTYQYEFAGAETEEGLNKGVGIFRS